MEPGRLFRQSELHQERRHSHIIGFRGGIGHRYAFTKNLSNSTTVFGSGFGNDGSSAGGWTDKRPANYGFRSALDFNLPLTGHFSLSGSVGGDSTGPVEAKSSRSLPGDFLEALASAGAEAARFSLSFGFRKVEHKAHSPDSHPDKEEANLDFDSD